MSVLRVYGPRECDARGVPLDWDQCRSCAGCGRLAIDGDGPFTCPKCGGHGSLKAAGLAARSAWAAGERDYPGEVRAVRPAGVDGFRTYEAVLDEKYGGGATVPDDMQRRCEDCGHPGGPMTEGTFEYVPIDSNDLGEDFRRDLELIDFYEQQARKYGGVSPMARLARGEQPAPLRGIHFSPCDEGCLHGAPIRLGVEGVEGRYRVSGHELVEVEALRPLGRQTLVEISGTAGEWAARIDMRHGPVEASWRPVDVRALGWAHDLRPEMLAVLCLRCWAGREHG